MPDNRTRIAGQRTALQRMNERAQLDDVRSLYVYAHEGTQKVPLESVSSVQYGTKTEKLRRRGQFRTITVSAFTKEGFLPSEVLIAARPQLDTLQAELPPGYRMAIGGEHEEQVKSFRNQARVMLMSTVMIFLALVIQFKHTAKPFIVFAGIPFYAWLKLQASKEHPELAASAEHSTVPDSLESSTR